MPGLLPGSAALAAPRGLLIEQISPHDTHGSNDEQPEYGQERQLDDVEGELIHRVMSPQVAAGTYALLRVPRLLGKEVLVSYRSSVDTVPAEHQGRAAKGNASAVPQGYSPDRLTVHERPVCRAEVHQH